MADMDKLEHVDFVIDNSGSLAETRKQVESVWKEVLSRRGRGH